MFIFAAVNCCNLLVSVILTASPDCSILATDVETGSVIARLEEAHGLFFFPFPNDVISLPG